MKVKVVKFLDNLHLVTEDNHRLSTQRGLTITNHVHEPKKVVVNIEFIMDIKDFIIEEIDVNLIK